MVENAQDAGLLQQPTDHRVPISAVASAEVVDIPSHMPFDAAAIELLVFLQLCGQRHYFTCGKRVAVSKGGMRQIIDTHRHPRKLTVPRTATN